MRSQFSHVRPFCTAINRASGLPFRIRVPLAKLKEKKNEAPQAFRPPALGDGEGRGVGAGAGIADGGVVGFSVGAVGAGVGGHQVSSRATTLTLRNVWSAPAPAMPTAPIS